MLATLGGLLALLLGLTLLLLPLLAPELSRPRDSAWGAVVLLLGLDLVTSADRLTGAPMLGVLCGGLLIGRLGLEVGQGRWRQLSEEEQQRLGSLERWTTSFRQLTITTAGFVERAVQGIGNLSTGFGQLSAGFGGLTGGSDRAATAPADQGSRAPARSGGKRKGKRWVRPESPADSPGADAGAAPAKPGPTAGDATTHPGSEEDDASPYPPNSSTAAPAPEAADGPLLAAEVLGQSEPRTAASAGATAVSPAGLLPAPATPEQDPEPAADPEAPEPESSSLTASSPPAEQPTFSRELPFSP
jgi:hypothetical protein